MSIADLAVIALLVSGAQLSVIAGTYARSLDDVYSLETLVVLPLGFLSGIFYSVDRLPEAWRFPQLREPRLLFRRVAAPAWRGRSRSSAPPSSSSHSSLY